MDEIDNIYSYEFKKGKNPGKRIKTKHGLFSSYD